MVRMSTRWCATIATLVSLFALAATADVESSTEPSPTTQPTLKGNGQAYVVVLEGEVNDYSRTMLARRLDQVKSAGGSVVILKVNTWGGSALSAIEISQLLKSQQGLHIIAFVEQKAISAGAMIALACNEIVMQPGSMIGDCAPIIPGEQLEKTERAKSEGPILAEFYDSAQRNGYDELLVSAMVSVGRVVYYIQSPGGERKFVDEEGYQKLVKDGDWKPVEGLPSPVDRDDQLLTVTADQAEKLGISKGTFATPVALASARGYGISGTLEHSAGENLVGFLSSNSVRGTLSVIFMISLYIAFQTPGHGAPEAVALSSLALLLGVPMLTGYAGWLEVLLILIGIALMAVELFIIPGFGFVGLTGIFLILLGLVLTFVPAEPSLPGWLPSLSGTWDALWRGSVTLTIALVLTLVLGAWVNKHLGEVPLFRNLVLDTAVGSTDSTNFAAAVSDDIWPEIGAVGRALTDLRPGGSAAFGDEVSHDLQVANVISDSGFVLANTQVVVREVHGNRIVVRPVDTA